MADVKQIKIRVEKESLKKLTVFNDRAELKRVFDVQLEKGLNEVLIENVSRAVNDDSVRVTGSGDATIEEVQVVDRRSKTGEGDTERAKELRGKKEELDENVKIIENEKTSIEKRIEAFNTMLTQVGNGIAHPKEQRFTADGETLDNINTFFTYYHEQSIKLRGDLRMKEKEQQKVQEELNVVNHELRKIEHGEYIKTVSVLLDSKEGGECSLELTYQVWGASWTPFYDVRVDTTDGKTTMQLSYYSNVVQTTGEDWDGADLVLSTARPCLGGNIPELGTLDVSWCREASLMMYNAKTKGGGYNMRGGSYARKSFGAAPCALEVAEEQCQDERVPMPQREALVSSQTVSTEFSITRPCSIPSDGATHKVTIGIVSFSPQLVHETVPSKNSSAFLTASSVNTSTFPILMGDASIYLDGAFVAKSVLKAVSPGERFSSSLGVDPAVKIDYKPVHKYHEQIGIINRVSSTVYEQKIIVKNTRADATLLTIKEHLPRSTDDKIKVKLISPESVEKISEDPSLADSDTPPAPGARLLPSNNLDWTVRLEKGGSQTLVLKYSVEHPLTGKIEFTERFN